MVDASRPTTHKMRFVSEDRSTHMLRTDWDTAVPLAPEVEEALLSQALDLLPRAQGLLLSDYAKGALTPRIIRTLITAARSKNVPVVVDPKGADYGIYAGATLIIRRVRPSVLVKGGDYRPEEVVGRELVEAAGGELLLVDLVPGQSSTRIVEQSRRTRAQR